jgi:hypothetical protein
LDGDDRTVLSVIVEFSLQSQGYVFLWFYWMVTSTV